MYGRQLAEIWDLFYRVGRGKDYEAEARQIVDLVRAANPAAESLLDVACGTGEHLATFHELLARVEGVDGSEHMASVAREKLPAVPVHIADMRDFTLAGTFDAVVCMNTGVAYLPSRSALRAAFRRMASHLTPQGLLLVEPWWLPERYLDGYIASDVVRGDDRSIARLSHTRRHGEFAQMDIHYLVADRDGVNHFTENHTFGLWSKEQYLTAFADAGCVADYVSDTVSGYGVFVARPTRESRLSPR